MTVGPQNKREARRWVRAHWSTFIANADMLGASEMQNDHIDAVWDDECLKIARRIDRGDPS